MVDGIYKKLMLHPTAKPLAKAIEMIFNMTITEQREPREGEDNVGKLKGHLTFLSNLLNDLEFKGK
jgi:hypothetical protein